MTFTRMDHTARDLLGSAVVPLRGSRESVWIVRVRKEFISLANGGPCSVPSEGLRGRCFASQTPGPSVSAWRGREGAGLRCSHTRHPDRLVRALARPLRACCRPAVFPFTGQNVPSPVGSTAPISRCAAVKCTVLRPNTTASRS